MIGNKQPFIFGKHRALMAMLRCEQLKSHFNDVSQSSPIPLTNAVTG